MLNVVVLIIPYKMIFLFQNIVLILNKLVTLMTLILKKYFEFNYYI